jgi:hypothetical protein
MMSRFWLMHQLLRENRWIDCLVNFRRLVSRSPEAKKAGPIKIAIIDDGVDASLVSLDGKIAIGESFCPYANSADLMSPYYVPAGNHGTVMATLICKVCPEVKLYVARLDERQSAGNRQRQITAKSAADVRHSLRPRSTLSLWDVFDRQQRFHTDEIDRPSDGQPAAASISSP